jgi:glutamine synthetase
MIGKANKEISTDTENVNELFGSNVFSDAVMKELLPKQVYKALKKTTDEGVPLDPNVAEVVANALKDWAIKKGATHYTHWFQPMTALTAEKHDAFIIPLPDGRVLLGFSGKDLIKGEPDASSFPSGGLRATFEARGYTAWDTTSPAFFKDKTLYIPTVFVSYTGEVLDKKTPLLRSMEALSKQALRVLRIFGNTTAKKVIATVGPEQEYFLVDKELYNQRRDLILTGRTLFGAVSPKGQELEDQYFGVIKERVSAFMQELDVELWKMGVSAKTKHNEVAPAQYELAPVFNDVNVGADHNHLVMETIKKVALHHGLVGLLHEKPYAGINGSGKHNNWSMSTDDGENLFEPGETPHENAQFLVFLAAVLRAVDVYADLLRVSASCPGNDHRLGANEAPPAIVSVFLGDQLTEIIEKIAHGGEVSSKKGNELTLGVSTLPVLPKDNTDRNRTSPFAFTGDKFEFRMVGSSQSISGPNFVLNTIVAETLCEIADKLEGKDAVNAEAQKIVQQIFRDHGRIVFNGNNYTSEWVKIAEERGLPNFTSTVEALPTLTNDRNVKLFEKHGVLNRTELEARRDIVLENYIKTINIEALTALEMARRQILPAGITFASRLADSINSVKATGIEVLTSAQGELLQEVSSALASLKKNINALEKAQAEAEKMHGDVYKQAQFYRDSVFAAINTLRIDADNLETMVDKNLWPFPTYADLLFNL